MADTQYIKSFKAVRRSSVPLVGIETPDPRATIEQTIGMLKEENPAYSWDMVGGLRARNKSAEDLLPILNPEGQPIKDVNILLTKTASKMVKGTVLYLINGHFLLQNPVYIQAIWNLRDEFKQNKRTLILLGPSFRVPSELKNDMLILDEPLPTKEEIETSISRLLSKNNIPALTPKVLDKASDVLKGLSMFAVEQSSAMSATSTGIDLEQLWERKRSQIKQTPGLSVYTGKETFKDVRGVENAKSFLGQLFKGRNPPTVLVFMDEIEKMFGGIESDLSGTSQEQHGEFLKWMQDNEVLGMMLVGHPGCSKSFLAKASAGEFEIPMVEFNVSAMKGGIVGQTGDQTRAALKTATAIGKPLVIATSNSLAILPPELKRRFKLGTWFFDLPTKEERNAVWELYMKKFEIDPKEMRPMDMQWTPDEIKTCCELSWRLTRPLVEVAENIVPVAKADPEKIERLRKMADKRFVSASKKGAYKIEDSQFTTTDQMLAPGREIGEA